MFFTVLPRTENRWKAMRKERQRCSEKLADLKRRLKSRGKARDAGSVEREVSEIIYKDFR